MTYARASRAIRGIDRPPFRPHGSRGDGVALEDVRKFVGCRAAKASAVALELGLRKGRAHARLSGNGLKALMERLYAAKGSKAE